MRELGALDAAHGSRAEDVCFFFFLEGAYAALQHQGCPDLVASSRANESVSGCHW